MARTVQVYPKLVINIEVPDGVTDDQINAALSSGDYFTQAKTWFRNVAAGFPSVTILSWHFHLKVGGVTTVVEEIEP